MLRQLRALLLGPAATHAKQALFGTIAQTAIYAPLAIWFVAHRDETFVCLSYGTCGIIVLLFAWSGWILTRRAPGGTA